MDVSGYEKDLDEALSSLKKTLMAKHHDYGTKNLVHRGVLGMIIRMEDKLARLENLDRLNESRVLDEKTTDTVIDIAGYAIQVYLYLSGKL